MCIYTYNTHDTRLGLVRRGCEMYERARNECEQVNPHRARVLNSHIRFVRM